MFAKLVLDRFTAESTLPRYHPLASESKCTRANVLNECVDSLRKSRGKSAPLLHRRGPEAQRRSHLHTVTELTSRGRNGNKPKAYSYYSRHAAYGSSTSACEMFAPTFTEFGKKAAHQHVSLGINWVKKKSEFKVCNYFNKNG